MQEFTIEVPDDLMRELQPYRDRLREVLALGLRQMKVREVLVLYEQGVVSLERAAELTALSREEIIQQARAYGIHPRWSEEMVRADLG